MLPVIPPTAKATKKKKRPRPNAAAAKRKRPPTTVVAVSARNNDDAVEKQNDNFAVAIDTASQDAVSTATNNFNDDVSHDVHMAADETSAEQQPPPSTSEATKPAASSISKTNSTSKKTAVAKKKKVTHPKIAKKINAPKKKTIITNPILGATSQQQQQQQQSVATITAATAAAEAMMPIAVPTIPAVTTDQLQPTPHESILPNNHHAENDTLLLAAEAAAALIDNHHHTANDESAVNLLTQVDLAAAAMGGGELNGEDKGGGLLLGERHDLVDTLAAFESEFGDAAEDDGALTNNNDANNENSNDNNNNSNCGSVNRQPSNFLTFTSRVPQNQPLSVEHTNFLSYYYSNESAGHNATGRGDGRKRDDEELVDNNINGDAKTMDWMEGGKPAAAAVVTLKSFCSKYPKSKNKDKSVKDEEGKEQELTDAATSTTATAAEATTATALTTEDNTTTTTTPPEAEGPQVEIINGEIVISQKSLPSHPETRTSTDQIDKEFGTVVEDETPTQLGAVQAKYDSYMTKPRAKSKRWSVEETKAFYRALRQCGTDFSMMQMFLEGRTRGQLKSKYKLELRKNGRLVDMALDPKSKLKLDLSVFGDGLEIPESVTPISRVSPSLGDGGGGEKVEEDNVVGEVVAAAAADNGAAMMERNFDHLFDDEEVDVRVKEDSVTANLDATSNNVGEVNKPAAEAQHKKSPAATESIPLALAPTVKKTKSKRPRAKPKAKAKKAVKKS